MQLNLTIKPKSIGLSLAILSIVLVILSLITEYIVEVIYQGSDAYWLHLLNLFSVNLEESIPTWFATILLFIASGLLALISLSKWRERDAFRWYWIGLSLAFLYLSMDEGAVIHEILSDPMNLTFSTTGYLFFGWQIVALPVVLIFALLYIRFLFALPPRSRYGIILAGLLYVAGAIFVEGLSADELYRSGSENYGYLYLSIATLEEAMELLGVVAFIYVLLDYVVNAGGHFVFSSAEEAVSLESETDELEEKKKPQPSADMLEEFISSVQNWAFAPFALLFLGGFNLAILAWLLQRELTAFWLSPERTSLFIAFGMGLGAWLGYRFAGYVKSKWLPWFAVFYVLLYISLPLTLRFLFLALHQLQADFISWYILPALLPLLVTAFYTLCLPNFVEKKQSRTSLYSAALIGLIFGCLSLVGLRFFGLLPLLISSAIFMLALLLFLGLARHLWTALAFISCTMLWFFPALNSWTNSLWFQQLRGLPANSSTQFTDYSSTQKIDVLQDATGNLYLYLDGVAQFHPPRTIQQNVLMGRVPASLLLPENALVIGAGSMQMELMMANYANHVTTVETDPTLLSISQQLFTSYNFMDRLQNRSLENAEPAEFLNRSEQSYELIALSYASVYSLRQGNLYTTEFFNLVSEHLSENGVFVVNLTEEFSPENENSRRIAATLLENFEQVIVVNSRSTGWSFAYAGQQLPFSVSELQAAIEVAGETEFGIFETSSVAAIAGNASSIESGFDWLFFTFASS